MEAYSARGVATVLRFPFAAATLLVFILLGVPERAGASVYACVPASVAPLKDGVIVTCARLSGDRSLRAYPDDGGSVVRFAFKYASFPGLAARLDEVMTFFTAAGLFLEIEFSPGVVDGSLGCVGDCRVANSYRLLRSGFTPFGVFCDTHIRFGVVESGKVAFRAIVCQNNTPLAQQITGFRLVTGTDAAFSLVMPAAPLLVAPRDGSVPGQITIPDLIEFRPSSDAPVSGRIEIVTTEPHSAVIEVRLEGNRK